MQAGWLAGRGVGFYVRCYRQMNTMFVCVAYAAVTYCTVLCSEPLPPGKSAQKAQQAKRQSRQAGRQAGWSGLAAAASRV